MCDHVCDNSTLILKIFCSVLKDTKPGVGVPDLPKNAGESSVANLDKLRHNKGDIPTAHLRLEMQKSMQKHAAVFRRGDVLKVSLVLYLSIFIPNRKVLIN